MPVELERKNYVGENLSPCNEQRVCGRIIGKDSDAGRDWGQEEKGTTEDGMAGWHHRLDEREFE